jgi:GDP-L-fucose synthase
MGIKKILVTGSKGFVGKNLLPYLQEENTLAPSKNQLDLLNKKELYNYIIDNQVTHVVHLAALCGGIGINKDNPGKFMYDNLIMGMNVIQACTDLKVSKLVNLGTVCSYPKFCKVPFNENDYWNGYPEETNAPYGIAKKTVIELSKAYNKQYGLNVTNLIPVNMAGPHDNFNLYSSHVIPAIVRKFEESDSSILLWGSGEASREFLDARDCSLAIVKALDTNTGPDPINIGTGRELKIKELAFLIKSLGNYKAFIEWDATKPDGQPRRCLDISRAKSILNWTPRFSLEQTIIDTINWYRSNK